ncbi:hypothetical protein HYC85_010311 [Camellia sinensis]|uniref:Uncharacterized protein n=1 Tax=Camellia sinensis TaxID=4442 RepID=A0A7J7HIZ2_CAMSI|nr:hypothetical protein HYC85_010311 [Camellia sinensis]
MARLTGSAHRGTHYISTWRRSALELFQCLQFLMGIGKGGHLVGVAFPQMMQRLSWDPMYYSFAILSLVREEKDDEDSFMVLHVPGKILRYNLGDKSFEKICDAGDEHCDGNGMIGDSLMYFWFHSFQYIEFVSCI